jgi:hypothetical protein
MPTEQPAPQREVSSVSTVELKALAYDFTKQIQFLQGQLGVVEQELIKRAQQSASVPSSDSEYPTDMVPG